MNDKDREWLKAALKAKGARKKISTRVSSSPAPDPKKKTIAKSPDFYRAMAAAKEIHACPDCGSCRCEKARNPHVNCEHD